VTRYEKTVFTSLLVFLPAGIAAALWFQVTRASSSVVIIGGEIAIFVLAFAINQVVLVVPLRRRFAAASERQDADALEAVLDEALAMWPRNARMRAYIDVNRPVVLMFRERWDEAVAQARGVLAGPVAPKHEALLLNNLAWALAHAGELEEAAAVGQRALARAHTDLVRASANGTLGAVYALQGEADRALDYLDAADAISRGGAAIQATRQYYRGMAFRLKQRDEDASCAFAAACAVAPTSLFGKRSAAILDEMEKSRR
jgi:tetratricopeptide (TPR) repeat protein